MDANLFLHPQPQPLETVTLDQYRALQAENDALQRRLSRYEALAAAVETWLSGERWWDWAGVARAWLELVRWEENAD